MQIPVFGLAGLFLAELILLFLLSRSLTSAVARFFYALTGSRRATVNILAIIFLPGTIIHELAHLLVAGMMFVPVGRIEILPQIDGDEVRLGSAEIGQTDMLRRMVIGLAPIIVGLLVMVGTLWLSYGNLSKETPVWQVLVVLYVIFQVGNSMFSSKKDMEGAVVLIAALLVILTAISVATYLTGLWPFFTDLNLPQVPLKGFFEKADLLLLVPLGVDVVFLGLAKVFNLKAG
ncbi:hypothetical protein A2874_00005 [Candidatus Daviesbacteria bacterium RIFCSPHIGHO2_01_FULL_43_17]|nr:MAG: hypothetical protein A2874_00005 [Candidatus Daviesbacteria bacterium RIFCSPHIGHO2_01_FULL_43_17]